MAETNPGYGREGKARSGISTLDCVTRLLSSVIPIFASTGTDIIGMVLSDIRMLGLTEENYIRKRNDRVKKQAPCRYQIRLTSLLPSAIGKERGLLKDPCWKASHE